MGFYNRPVLLAVVQDASHQNNRGAEKNLGAECLVELNGSGVVQGLGEAKKKRQKRHSPRRQQFESLEDRVMLAVASQADQLLPVVDDPLEVQLAPINHDAHHDLAALGAEGKLTVALNGGDDSFSDEQTFDPALGPLNGMSLARLDADLLTDLVLQGPDSLQVLTGDGTGSFSPRQSIDAATPASLAPSGGGRVGMDASALNADFFTDLVTPAPGTNEVLVFLGAGDGTLADPDRYAGGGVEPVVVATGDFIGDLFPDIAVGHTDGTVAFLEGRGDGTFLTRPDLNLTGLGAVTDLAAGGFDGDGDLDLAVSGTDRVNVLLNDNDLLSSSPLVNGDFSAGLTGWETEVVGHTAGATPGRVNALGGFAQLTENESFLISLQQTFVVPPSPETISVDVVSLGLEDAAGGVPDVFEISLLDDSSNSLVPTHRPEATSFFNVNPDGEIFSAAGVTFDGTTVTLDISGIAPGAAASLYFDLIGNPQGTSSVAAIDNVSIAPEKIFTNTFTVVQLAGPFSAAAGVAAGDVDGDGNLDIVLADSGADRLLVYNGDGSGGYLRSEFDVSPFGSAPAAVAAAPLTQGDSTADVALTLLGSSLALTPLGANAAPELVSAAAGGNEGAAVNFVASFSDPDAQDSHTATIDWKAKNLDDPEGIATDGTDIWIVDEDEEEIFLYAGAASRLSGDQDPDFSFELHDDNEKPTGLTTDGSWLWVSDKDEDAVFVYAIDGSYLGSWELDDDNGSPRGITINPSGGDDLWVVDRSDDVIYFYAGAATRLSGSQAATAIIPLDDDNSSPEGIADPSATINIGDVVSDSISVVGEVDQWQFNAAAGQSIFIDWQANSGGGTVYTLRAPDGTALLSDSNSGANGLDNGPVLLLSAAGVYSLDVTGRNNDTPSYQFQIWDVPPPDETTINIGDVAVGAIETPGVTDVWNFDAVAGQSVYFDWHFVNGGRVDVTFQAPDGSTLYSDGSSSPNGLDSGPFLLAQTGTYTLSASGREDETPTYQFQLYEAITTISTIPFDQAVADTIAAPGTRHIYEFSSDGTEIIFIDFLSFSGGRGTFRLTDPGGATLATEEGTQAGDLDRGPITLSAAGSTTRTLTAAGTRAKRGWLAGWTVYADANGSGTRDAGELFSTTDSAGNYLLAGLLPGAVTVAAVPQPGWDPTAPAGVAHQVTLAEGETLTGVDFGNFNNGSTANRDPAFTSTPLIGAKVNHLYRYDASASDPDGDALTYALLSAPAGMTVDAASGLVVWRPSADQQVVQDVLLQASDGQGGVALRPFHVFVAPEFQSPTISSAPPLLATVEQPYSYNVTALDPDDDPLTFTLDASPAGMEIDLQSGELTWLPGAADLGPHTIVIRVDDGTAGPDALQTYTLDVRPVNTPPQFTSDPLTDAQAGEIYRYDADAVDAEDGVRFSLVSPPLGMAINATSGLVTWATALSDLGQHNVTIRATDDRGAVTDQAYTLSVAPDTEAPSVSVLTSSNLLNPGEQVTIQVVGSDNVEVSTVGLEIDGNPVALDANNTATFTPTNPGIIHVVGTATDSSNNSSSTSRLLRVIDASDNVAPTVAISSPAPNGRVTYLTDVVGTVVGEDVEFYRLQYALSGTQQWTTFAEQQFLPSTDPNAGNVNLVDAVLGTFDPTLLANDIYDLRLTAQDFNGNIGISQIFLSVEGQAKLGNYSVSFTDLSIPMAGIPIEITRTYDTLNAPFSGDFGFGWNLSIGEARIRETLPVSQRERDGVPALFGGAQPFFAGTRVYVTTPDGQRAGFTFDPVPEGGLLGTVWRPRFVPDPGVLETLEVGDIALSQRGDGTFGLYLIGLPYNPREYTLTTKDGLRYRYDQFDELLDVTDRNGVKLTYTDDGIFSSTGESIDFVRDSQGRITEIIDPAGNSIRYTYDAARDLRSATDQVSNTTTMDYRTDVPHFLERITGPDGNLINEVKYDENNRFLALVDALGNEVQQQYDLDANTFIQTDRLGNPTTLI